MTDKEAFVVCHKGSKAESRLNVRGVYDTIPTASGLASSDGRGKPLNGSGASFSGSVFFVANALYS